MIGKTVFILALHEMRNTFWLFDKRCLFVQTRLWLTERTCLSMLQIIGWVHDLGMTPCPRFICACQQAINFMFFWYYYFVLFMNAYVQIYFSHDINVIILLQIIDQKYSFATHHLPFFLRRNWPPFFCYCACNAIMKYNTSQRNNYFLFAITSLINTI